MENVDGNCIVTVQPIYPQEPALLQKQISTTYIQTALENNTQKANWCIRFIANCSGRSNSVRVTVFFVYIYGNLPGRCCPLLLTLLITSLSCMLNI